MPALYCIWALLIFLAVPASAQQAPVTRTTGFSIFLQGSPIGHEDVTTQEDADGLVITAQARRSPPAVAASGSIEIRYRADGSPQLFFLESTTHGREFSLRTTLTENTAVSAGTQ